ncbi:hypothetical protein CYMTET_50140 [Cymbomonas tetramitiformis]|uniref:Uncharacterized protein n=1 Tax=Cymbomonas tetramitiformis TaxID=36881 RepID=A0AAE0BQN4_9CHLO|nr:hypothetical protein CYMTET_50140 [Cymbomonas tetramitiformis]
MKSSATFHKRLQPVPSADLTAVSNVTGIDSGSIRHSHNSSSNDTKKSNAIVSQRQTAPRPQPAPPPYVSNIGSDLSPEEYEAALVRDLDLDKFGPETPEYKAAYTRASNPLPMDVLGPRLEELIEPCSSSKAGSSFCNNCVRPLQRELLKTYYEGVDPSLDDDLTAMQKVANRDKAVEEALTYMEGKGLIVDSYFSASVVECNLYTEEKLCPVPKKRMEYRLGIVAENCKAVEEQFVADFGTRIPSKDQLTAEAKKLYCKKCYWRFLRALINIAPGDEFWCKYLENPAQFKASLKSDGALVDRLFEDDSFLSCVQNGKQIIENKGVDPYVESLVDYCWDPENLPRNGSIIKKQTQAYLDSLDCSKVDTADDYDTPADDQPTEATDDPDMESNADDTADD